MRALLAQGVLLSAGTLVLAYSAMLTAYLASNCFVAMYAASVNKKDCLARGGEWRGFDW